MKSKNSTDLLPFTRKKQLWFLIKDNPSLLFFVNFTAAMFFIPLGFVATWLLISLSSAAGSANPTNATYFYAILFPGLCFIPAIMIAGLGMAGLYGVINDLVLRDISKYTNYWSYIKKNWLQFLLYHFWLGLFFSFSVINVGVYLFADLAPFFKICLLTINIALFVIFFFIKPFVLFQATLFDNNLMQIVKNSIGFIGKRFLFNLLCFVLGLIMYVLVIFLPGDFLRIVPVIIIATFWLMFTTLINYIVCIDTLEKKLPKEQTKDFYHHGLEED